MQLIGVFLFLLASPPFGQCAVEAARRIVLNDDAQVLGEAPATDTSAFVQAWLDREVAFVPFNTFVFLAATPDICTYDTQVGEVYAARMGPAYNGGWARGMRGLRAEGTDALELVTQHMKAKGIDVLAGIRMSDTHHRSLDRANPFCPLFALDHPAYVIKQPDGRTNETALDYSYPEVRAYRLAIMQEIAEQYDVDGLELNFVRWAKHFPRDQGRANAPIMTAYVGKIRRMLDDAARQRGCRRLILAVRVPESVHACWLAGVDIETWVNEGWIDYVVVATWNNTDPQIPVEQFTRFTKPAGVDTIVLMGNMMGPIWSGPPTVLDRGIAMSAKHANGYQGMLITETEARGAAANYYAWGVDSISFWNVGIHFGGQKSAALEQRERIRRWTHAVHDPSRVDAGPRAYHYLPLGKGISARKPPQRNYPWYDEGRSALGHANGPVLRFTPARTGTRLVFPFRMADGRNGERLSGTLRFWIYHVSKDDRVDIDINGKMVDAARIRRSEAGSRRGGLPGLRYEIALADCPPFAGDNQLGLILRTRRPRQAEPYMEELIVMVESTRLEMDLHDPGNFHSRRHPAGGDSKGAVNCQDHATH